MQVQINTQNTVEDIMDTITDFVEVLPAGYTITVTSWENDADNYNTKQYNTLDKDEAQAICALLDSIDDIMSNIVSVSDIDGPVLAKFILENPAILNALTEVDKKRFLEDITTNDEDSDYIAY